jgi:hypothetical protein
METSYGAKFDKYDKFSKNSICFCTKVILLNVLCCNLYCHLAKSTYLTKYICLYCDCTVQNISEIEVECLIISEENLHNG